MWDLTFPTRIKLMPPTLVVQSLKHWTTGKSLSLRFEMRYFI